MVRNHPACNQLIGLTLGLLLAASTANADSDVTILSQMRHLRSGQEREWSSFPQNSDGESLTLDFQASRNASDWTLSVRQQDVKETWKLSVNEQELGRLVRDENDLITDFTIPAGLLNDGANSLEIRSARAASDDIRVGMIHLHPTTPAEYRRTATVEIEINDVSHRTMPGRITIVDRRGTLIPVGAVSNENLAVREGVVYTATGNARFGVAAGDYRIYAGRGFEYGVGSADLRVDEGQHAKRTIVLSRQVDTVGWVACDTHIHTVTHSGHGDATIDERIITLAGESIELPIATDHNKHIDYRPTASRLKVNQYFTPVIGNEVTTKQGHFNIFPVQAGAATPDHTVTDWPKLFDNIFSTPNVQVAILNHGRDIHGGFRPFSPRHHLSISGENLDQRVLQANAMELINSGAVQSDPMQLLGDWCGLVNRGLAITPVGSSDSHDVTRYIVGQGRTYIRCDDSDVEAIDVDAATEAFLAGRVMVAYGLLVKLVVNDRFHPGDLATIDDDQSSVDVQAEVLAPHWGRPQTVALYLNGRQKFVSDLQTAGEDTDLPFRSTMKWRLPRSELRGDVWLCAVATGGGITDPYWPTAKPYQPDSPRFVPYTFASTGPIRIDVDGDGNFTSAYQYAQQVIGDSKGDVAEVIGRLKDHDDAVIVQAASILSADAANENSLRDASAGANDRVRAVVTRYLRHRRDSTVAKLEEIE